MQPDAYGSNRVSDLCTLTKEIHQHDEFGMADEPLRNKPNLKPDKSRMSVRH